MTEKKMIADSRFMHRGNWLKAGDPFETDEENGKDLKAMNMAHFATVIERIEEAAESTMEAVASAVSSASRSRYRNRAMQAQGSKSDRSADTDTETVS